MTDHADRFGESGARGQGAHHGEEAQPQARRGQGEFQAHHGEGRELGTIGAGYANQLLFHEQRESNEPCVEN